MKFALVLLFASVVISYEQLQRSRVIPWLTSYSSFINKYQPLYFDDVAQQDIPIFRYARPIRPTPSYIYSLPNEDFNQDWSLSEDSQEIDGRDEFLDTQSRINRFKGYNNHNVAGRFFYGTTINNPFYKTATFTISSTVTTLGSIVLCVPSNNLAAVPSPTCAGRKKREDEDSEDHQFPIAPSEILKSVIPTVLLPLDKGPIEEANQQLPNDNRRHLLSSKNEDFTAVQGLSNEDETNNYREKRLFGGGIAASTTLTRYSFVGATLTSTVVLDSTGQGVAACLPSGYVVCG